MRRKEKSGFDLKSLLVCMAFVVMVGSVVGPKFDQYMLCGIVILPFLWIALGMMNND